MIARGRETATSVTLDSRMCSEGQSGIVLRILQELSKTGDASANVAV